MGRCLLELGVTTAGFLIASLVMLSMVRLFASDILETLSAGKRSETWTIRRSCASGAATESS